MKTIFYTVGLSVRFGGLAILLGNMTIAVRAADTAMNSSALGRIGNTEIKVEEVRASLSEMDPRELMAVNQDVNLLNQTVHSLLLQRVVYKEALEKKWEQQPSMTVALEQARMKTIADSYLRSITQPPDSYPSEAELKEAYEANRNSIQAPRQYRLAQIFVSSPKGAGSMDAEKARVKLDAIWKSLRPATADFGAIAREQSDEKQTARVGGEMGWFAEVRIPGPIREKISGQSVLTITEPIRLDDGWHIVKLMEIKEAHTPTLDEVRAQLSLQMRAERAAANRKAYLAQLLEKNPVAINEPALANILAKPAVETQKATP